MVLYHYKTIMKGETKPMATKKKLPPKVDLAAGFFSTPAVAEDTTVITEEEKNIVHAESTSTNVVKETAPTKDIKKATTDSKNLGGRPSKTSQNKLKNLQYTLTMHPKTYEQARVLAEQYTRGNFSALIFDALNSFCNEKNLVLDDIEVDEEIMEMYRVKQEKKDRKSK